MRQDQDDIVIPVIREEAHVDAKPVQTGSVRVTKTVDHRQELIEQELRKGLVEVRRVQVSRLVDGPQEPYRSGDTLVVPVVSEVLVDGQKRWQLTEEIYLAQHQQIQTVRQTVDLAEEKAKVERLDSEGNVRPVEAGPVQPTTTRLQPRSIIPVPEEKQPRESSERVLSSRDSMLKRRTPKA